jgi:hypothetical protein
MYPPRHIVFGCMYLPQSLFRRQSVVSPSAMYSVVQCSRQVGAALVVEARPEADRHVPHHLKLPLRSDLLAAPMVWTGANGLHVCICRPHVPLSCLLLHVHSQVHARIYAHALSSFVDSWWPLAWFINDCTGTHTLVCSHVCTCHLILQWPFLINRCSASCCCSFG